ILHGLKKAFTPENEEYVLVDMGAPKFNWRDIPLAMPEAEAAKKIAMPNPQFVSMGNPHVVFFIRFAPDDTSEHNLSELTKIDLANIGPRLEQLTEVFPERVNVSIAMLRGSQDGQGYIINARVWERGAGLTEACGTAACAILAAANKRDAR